MDDSTSMNTQDENQVVHRVAHLLVGDILTEGPRPDDVTSWCEEHAKWVDSDATYRDVLARLAIVTDHMWENTFDPLGQREVGPVMAGDVAWRFLVHWFAKGPATTESIMDLLDLGDDALVLDDTGRLKVCDAVLEALNNTGWAVVTGHLPLTERRKSP